MTTFIILLAPLKNDKADYRLNTSYEMWFKSKRIKQYSKRIFRIFFSILWEKYSKHPKNEII